MVFILHLNFFLTISEVFILLSVFGNWVPYNGSWPYICCVVENVLELLILLLPHLEYGDCR